jgi:hypothetical protein
LSGEQRDALCTQIALLVELTAWQGLLATIALLTEASSAYAQHIVRW